MKTKLQIKSISGRVLFEYESKNNTIAKTLNKAISIGADLSGADLKYADLKYADLIDADLRGADLKYANLRGADLIGADLKYANLRGTNLIGANLRGADLIGADLKYADLSGADLRGADIDFSCMPLWCGDLKANYDDRQIIQQLYHVLSHVKHSTNASEEIKDLLSDENLEIANKFHRIGECEKL